MAKKTLMSDIASDVREIKESKSKFGTKLPGNGNKAQELTLKELSYEQMIMGSIASLVWGVKNINKDTQVKTLLGRNNIFDIVDSLICYCRCRYKKIPHFRREFNCNMLI